MQSKLMPPVCYIVLVAAYVKIVMQESSQQVLSSCCQDRVAIRFPAGVNNQDVWWLTGSDF